MMGGKGHSLDPNSEEEGQKVKRGCIGACDQGGKGMFPATEVGRRRSPHGSIDGE